MKKYALHDTVHELLSSFAAKPNGNLLITGVKGSGLTMSISYLVHSIYGGKERPGEVIRIHEGTIDEVRDVIKQISKSRTNLQKPRLVIIDDAQKLTVEAQNALLKNVEEPPRSTHFVFATTDTNSLLETIRSRCTHIYLKRPPVTDLKEIFHEYSDAQFDKAYLIADGWPGSMRSLLEDPNSEIAKEVEEAKAYMKKKRWEKIAYITSIESDSLEGLLKGLLRISSASMQMSAQENKVTTTQKWQEITNTLLEIEAELDNGLNSKLAGLRLSLYV